MTNEYPQANDKSMIRDKKAADNPNWTKDIYPYMPEALRRDCSKLSRTDELAAQEIRVRAGQPMTLKTSAGERVISGRPVSRDELGGLFAALCEHSVYSRQEEVRMGYLTLHGGHRVGVCGRVVMEGSSLKLIRDIGSLNIRIAREIPGCADKVIRYIKSGDKIFNTLVLSGPGMGKTTLLRDIARQLGSGDGEYALCVGVIDERSELAACYKGSPQLDVGAHTDVLDGCPKGIGFSMMLRAMAPRVIVTDEVGRSEDIEAIEDALGAGVSVVASAHGQSLAELERRPVLKEILGRRYFQRYIVLGGRAGALLEVLDGEGSAGMRRDMT